MNKASESRVAKICIRLTGKPSIGSILKTRDHRAFFALLTGIAILGFIVAVFLDPERAINCMIWNWETSGVFPDFSESVYITADLRPYESDLSYIRAVYLPLVYLILYPLKFIIPGISDTVFVDNNEIILIFSLIFAVFFFLFYLAVKKNTGLDRRIILLLMIFIGISAPMLFCIERGNILFIALALSTISILTYKDKKKTILSLLCLALAINVKPYLVILILPYLFDKRYKDLKILVILSSLFFFIPMLLLGGLQDIPALLSNMLNLEDMNQGSGIFGYKIGLGNTAELLAYIAGSNLNNHALLVVKIILSIVLLYSAKASRHQWERVSALILILLMFLNTSWIYNALYFSIPLVLILNDEEKSKKTMYFLLLLFLILVPLPYGFAISGLPGGNQVSYSTIVCSISVIVLTLSVIFNNITSPLRKYTKSFQDTFL